MPDHTDLIARLLESARRIGNIAAGEHPLRMSIPGSLDDDDIFIVDTLMQSKDALAAHAAEIERLLDAYAPHWCADDHAPIRHWDDTDERCPMCRLTAERDALRKELEIARLDSAMIDWLERSAAKPRGKIEIAASILKRGFEIGEWPSMHVTVSTGRLRDAIDAAMAREKP